jgi:hypothetical protein
MTMRFMLGIGLVALLGIVFVASAYWLINRKRFIQRSRRRLRRRGRAVRIDDFMVKPDEAESAER